MTGLALYRTNVLNVATGYGHNMPVRWITSRRCWTTQRKQSRCTAK